MPYRIQIEKLPPPTNKVIGPDEFIQGPEPVLSTIVENVDFKLILRAIFFPGDFDLKIGDKQ